MDRKSDLDRTGDEGEKEEGWMNYPEDRWKKGEVVGVGRGRGTTVGKRCSDLKGEDRKN